MVHEVVQILNVFYNCNINLTLSLAPKSAKNELKVNKILLPDTGIMKIHEVIPICPRGVLPVAVVPPHLRLPRERHRPGRHHHGLHARAGDARVQPAAVHRHRHQLMHLAGAGADPAVLHVPLQGTFG